MIAPTTGLRREVLANGVTLLVQQRTTAPVSALVTHVRAGFLDEPDDLVGISHVLEHMLFKGTPSMGPGELAQRTKAIGGTLNAYTSYDRTVYYAAVPAANTRELVALQADQVQHASLDADELHRELGVIIQEARRKLDTPGDVAGETLHALLYQQHRIRRWRIGTDADLERFTRDDVAGYYHSRYTPDRMIVSLVTAADANEALDWLRTEWGRWTAAASAIPAGPHESSRAIVRAQRMTGDVQLAEVVLGWRAPGVLDAQVPVLDLLAGVLGSGRGSRFARELRQPGLVSGVGVSSYGVVDTGVFAIGLELEPASIPAALGVIGRNLSALASDLVSADELARPRALLRAQVARRVESYDSRAIAFADAEALGDVTRIDREDADLLAVTPEQVRDAARQWLELGGVSGVAYLPATSGQPFDAEVLTAMAPVVSSTKRRKAAVTGTLAPPVHHIALAHHDILTARFGSAGQTSLAIHRPRQVETASDAGLAMLGMRALLRGTERLDAAALAYASELLGGAIGASVGADFLSLGTTVLSENTMAAAALLRDVLHRPRFEPGDIGIERDLLLADARSVADDMLYFPIQLLLGQAFADTGYGAPSLGTADSLSTFDTTRVRDWHGRMLRGGRTTVIAVGDGDPVRLAGDLAELLDAETSDLQTGATAVDPGATIQQIHPGVRVEQRDRQQSALAMLFPGPSRRDPARFVAETWSAIAGGLGGRMFESLRSARSLGYTVIANSWQRRDAGGLLCYIATEPARLAEARDAMLEELTQFRDEPPSSDEVQRSVAMLAGHAQMSRQTAGSYSRQIADAWLLGEGLHELEDLAAPYRRVTAEAVHQLAAESLDPARRAEGVVEARPVE